VARNPPPVMKPLAVLAALAVSAGAARAQSAERPVIKPGDHWHFSTTINGAPVAWLDRDWIITSVTPLKIEGTENGRPLTLTADLNNVESPQRKDSDLRLLQFPLAIGKQWGFMDYFTLTSVDQPSRGDFRVAVVAYGKVRVPAGEFDAFELIAQGGWSADGLQGGTTWTYWYAPAARAIVKMEERDTLLGARTSELSAFSLQP